MRKYLMFCVFMLVANSLCLFAAEKSVVNETRRATKQECPPTPVFERSFNFKTNYILINDMGELDFEIFETNVASFPQTLRQVSNRFLDMNVLSDHDCYKIRSIDFLHCTISDDMLLTDYKINLLANTLGLKYLDFWWSRFPATYANLSAVKKLRASGVEVQYDPNFDLEYWQNDIGEENEATEIAVVKMSSKIWEWCYDGVENGRRDVKMPTLKKALSPLNKAAYSKKSVDSKRATTDFTCRCKFPVKSFNVKNNYGIFVDGTGSIDVWIINRIVDNLVAELLNASNAFDIDMTCPPCSKVRSIHLMHCDISRILENQAEVTTLLNDYSVETLNMYYSRPNFAAGSHEEQIIEQLSNAGVVVYNKTNPLPEQDPDEWGDQETKDRIEMIHSFDNRELFVEEFSSIPLRSIPLFGDGL